MVVLVARVAVNTGCLQGMLVKVVVVMGVTGNNDKIEADNGVDSVAKCLIESQCWSK